MDFLRAIILGTVQGLTEFIPVSSSGHLVLVPWALGWPAPGLAFDTVLHLGSLLAVLVYFRHEWLAVISGFFRSIGGPSRPVATRLADPGSRLAWWIIIGSIPAGIAGVAFENFFEGLFNNPRGVAVFLLLTALILTLSEKLARRTRDIASLTARDSALIGLAQAAAIAPGLSRSGATIATGMALGLTRDAAARFSFLLSAPPIVGAGLLKVLDLAQAGSLDAALPVLAAGFIAAVISGYLCIRFLLDYLRRGKLYVFAAYCLVVGLATLAATTFR